MTTKTKWLPLCFSVLALGCPGQTTDNGDGGTGDMPVQALSARAQRGLTAGVSPFTIDTTGMTIAQQEQVGIGSYLVNAVGGCADCHDQTVPGSPPTVKFLAGGTKFA